jgi:hypothetical protein
LKREEIGHAKGRIERIKFFMEKQKTLKRKRKFTTYGQ